VCPIVHRVVDKGAVAKAERRPATPESETKRARVYSSD